MYCAERKKRNRPQGRSWKKGVLRMKAAIFTIDSGIYKAKAESAAATALKRMLEHVGFQVKAAGALPQDRAMTAEVMEDSSRTRLPLI